MQVRSNEAPLGDPEAQASSIQDTLKQQAVSEE